MDATPTREERVHVLLGGDGDVPRRTQRWNRRLVVVTRALAIVLTAVLALSIWQARPPLAFRRGDPSSSSSAAGAPPRGQVFKILQLADLHFGENSWTDWGPEQDRKSVSAIASVLRHEPDADLVILSGDQLTANNIVHNATTYLRMIIDAMIDARPDVRWATVYGNHDDAAYEEWRQDEDGQSSVTYHGAETSRADLTAVDASYRGSLTQSGPTNVFGASNYCLNIYGRLSLGTLGRGPACRIYLLDSGGGSLDEKLDRTQVSWLQEQVARYPDVPSVAFQHIPTSYNAFRYGDGGDDDLNACAGLDGEGSVSPVTSDAGIFDVVSSSENIHFLSVGHNHGNDYCCQRDGISVCFGRHSGYGGYGSWDRGSRVFIMELDENDVFSWYSYVRMESGEVANEYYPIA